MKKPLSKKQHQIYRLLIRFHEKSGVLPNLSELSRELSIHYTTLRQHLQALADKGYLRFESRGTGRAPQLALLGTALGIPVLGDIPAGPLSEAIQSCESYLALSGGGGLFALEVRGSSMADLIQDGDLVLLDKNAQPNPGDICALRVDENEVTLKYLHWNGPQSKTRILRPHNPQYSPMEVAADRLYVEGVYRGLLRGNIIPSLLKDTEGY